MEIRGVVYLTTGEAAEALGITDARVRQLVRAGELPAQRFGRALMIAASDLDTARQRKTQRGPLPTSYARQRRRDRQRQHQEETP